jgi:hypothetical protein
MKKIFALLLVVLFTASCKKDKVPEPTPDLQNNPNQGDLASFFSKYAAPVQSYVISASSATTIVGSGGTTVSIPASAFALSDGSTQVIGVLEVKLTEINSKKDLIINKTQTTTHDDIILTNGIINISASQGEEELVLLPTKTISISYSNGSLTPTSDKFAFKGKSDIISGNLIWVPDTVGGTNAATTGTTSLPYYYKLSMDTLHWINCGKFNFAAGTKTNFTVTTHGNYNRANTEIFLYFPTAKSVAYLDKPGAQTWNSTYRVPIGTAVKIIGISRINGNFYSSFTDVTMSSGLVKDLDFTATNEGDLITALGGL